MNVIARKTLRTFWTATPAAEAPMAAWLKVVEKARWDSFRDVQATFNSVDLVAGTKLVFNIGGGKFRLVAHASFQLKTLFVLFVGTHGDYDKIKVEDL